MANQFLLRLRHDFPLALVPCHHCALGLSAGEASEAMILASERLEEGGHRIVCLLDPPALSAPGDRVFLEGLGLPAEEPPKQMKSEIWKAVAPELKITAGHRAGLSGRPLAVVGKGPITVPAIIPEGASVK